LYYIYQYEGLYYKIPLIATQIKFWDYDFANIIGETNNFKSKEFSPDSFGYRHTKNHYYDLHIFTNDLLMMRDPILSGKNLMPTIPVNSEIVKLFETVVPPIYYGRSTKNTSYGRLKPDIEYITPHKLLTQNPYI